MAQYILGIRVDSLTKEEARRKAEMFLGEGRLHTVFTPNPEMLVKAKNDRYFSDILNQSDLNICDGFGIRLVSGFKIRRLTGVEYMLEICKIVEKTNQSVYLLGSGDTEVVEKTKEKLQEFFPLLKISGYNKGPDIQEKGRLVMDETKNNEILAEISHTGTEILFVAFGMGKQEKWIWENKGNLPSVKIAMGVGGSFDYLSGKIKRAPRLMRLLGLEWLCRLIQEPKRFGRILNATIKFLFLVIRYGR